MEETEELRIVLGALLALYDRAMIDDIIDKLLILQEAISVKLKKSNIGCDSSDILKCIASSIASLAILKIDEDSK